MSIQQKIDVERPGSFEILDAIEKLSAATELAHIIKIVRDTARKLSGADGVCVILREGDSCHYVDEAAIGPLWKGRRFPMSTCISGWCMLNRATAVIPDIYEDPRIPHDAYRPTFVKSLIMVPVRAEDPIAAIGVYWAKPHIPSQTTVSILEGLARSTATAIVSVKNYEALRASEARLARLIEALPVAVYTTDAEGRVTYLNEAAAKLVGQSHRSSVPGSFVSCRLYRPDGVLLAHDECPMALCLKERRTIHDIEIMVERPDGHRVQVITYSTPLQETNGRLTGAVNVLVDISERKKAEELQRILIREVQHRSNNLLAVLQAIAQKSLGGAGPLVEARTRFEGRLQALARINRRLTNSDWAGLSLENVIRSELEPFSERAQIEGPDIVLRPQQAQNLALAVHELATNAIKHGSLSSPSGEVSVFWQLPHPDDRQTLTLHWRERGGPSSAGPRQRGSGMSLISAIFERVRFDYGPDGLSGEFDLALE